MRLSAIAALIVAVIACGKEPSDDKPSVDRPTAPPADAALDLDEIRGRRLCAKVVSAKVLAQATGVAELAMAAGYLRAGDEQLSCLYLWPVQGSPQITIDLRFDCRADRSKTADMAALWSDAGVTGETLTREPRPEVFQLFRDLDDPGCQLTVTTGFSSQDFTPAIAELATAGLSPQLVLAIGSKSEVRE